MKFIDEEKIQDLLRDALKPANKSVERILAKSRSLKRLTLKESAILLSIEDKNNLREIFSAAAFVKEEIYGKRVVLFAPLYISNICVNNCLYCAFKADNNQVKRKTLSMDEIKEQVEWLLKRGHKRILMIAGESLPAGETSIDYLTEAVRAIYSVSKGAHKVKRVNVNCAPLSTEEFRRLKAAGIGTYQIFQETYHEATYRLVHPKGPKCDPDNRIDAVDRAHLAGIDDIGIGVLYGLYDWRFETLALLSHVEHMEERFNVGPHTISVPRIEPALGAEFSLNPPYKVSDEQFKRIVAILRLSVAYTGLILSTRETPQMRDELFSLGVSQVSAESRTSPGGYSSCENEKWDSQFSVGDHRSLDEVIGSLIAGGSIPSFCAACYRKERTGEAFMNLAKPGTIKGKCSLNALITLKEYLDDFASVPVREAGYQLIRDISLSLKKEELFQLDRFFADINQGLRDKYV
jgi:2-iminoacetate synthase